jgi:hypothetical protein
MDMRVSSLLVTLAGSALLVSCQIGDAERDASERSPIPETSAPEISGGPPPAWVETEHGAYWLGFSSYCFEDYCFEDVAPTCEAEDVPKVRVRSGETVRFHLRFKPTEVLLEFLSTRILHPYSESVVTRREGLDAGTAVDWRVDTTGLTSLVATGPQGEVNYVSCLLGA